MNITEIKEFIAQWSENNFKEFETCSQFLFDNPELGMQEHKAVHALTQIAHKHGFSIEQGAAHMPTAFVGSYGSGSPVLAFNIEYDALPGLSQAVKDTQDPVIPNAPGHGCGHCLLGPGALFAAIALRYALEKFSLNGTIKIFGSPAEEICIGKPFMARAGLFDRVDAFLDWHPWFNETFIPRGSNAYFSKYYHFSGKTSHGNAPWNGRSALDAGMLMGHAVELLREHIPPGTEHAANTINYTFSNTGPEFPSVVPDKASLWFIGRANTVEILVDMMQRIDNCARGCALATDTTVDMQLVTAIHENIPNTVLAQVLHDNSLALGEMLITEEEQVFAKNMQKNAGNPPSGIVQKALTPCTKDGAVTDISEYSWIAPTSTLWLGTLPGPALHHWVITAASGSSIGKKTLRHVAKILAGSAIDLLTSPELLQKAKAEHAERLQGRQYTCLIPEEIKPPIFMNKEVMEKYKTT